MYRLFSKSRRPAGKNHPSRPGPEETLPEKRSPRSDKPVEPPRPAPSTSITMARNHPDFPPSWSFFSFPASSSPLRLLAPRFFGYCALSGRDSDEGQQVPPDSSTVTGRNQLVKPFLSDLPQLLKSHRLPISCQQIVQRNQPRKKMTKPVMPYSE